MGKDPGSIQMDEPLALFPTWTTYGSWLPGDDWGPRVFRHRQDAKRYSNADSSCYRIPHRAIAAAR